MIHAFDLYSHFLHDFHVYMFSFMYMPILSKLKIYMYTPFESFCLSYKSLLWTQLCLEICMYTLVCTRHTYTLKDSSFDDFHVLRNFLLSLIAYFHDDMFHITLVHSLYLLVSHDFIFMSMIWAI